MKLLHYPNHAFIFIIIILLVFLGGSFSSAQTAEKDSTDHKKDQTKTIAEVIKSCVKYPGLFNMYQDSTDGKAYLEISGDKIGKEFIHFFHVENSPMDAGWLKGSFGSESVFSINKSFDKIEFVEENPHYYFDPDNAISKAAGADINRPMNLFQSRQCFMRCRKSMN